MCEQTHQVLNHILDFYFAYLLWTNHRRRYNISSWRHWCCVLIGRRLQFIDIVLQRPRSILKIVYVKLTTRITHWQQTPAITSRKHHRRSRTFRAIAWVSLKIQRKYSCRLSYQITGKFICEVREFHGRWRVDALNLCLQRVHSLSTKTQQLGRKTQQAVIHFL